MVPRTTPREVLYIETGLMDIEHITQKNRINMEKRINSNPTSLTFKVKEKGAKQGWKYNTEKIRNKWNITDQDMDGTSQQVKNMVKEKCIDNFIKEIELSGNEKSKVKHLLKSKTEQWRPGKHPLYITQLTRKQVSTIFKTRTRMLEVKNNYRGKFPNNRCRACSSTDETQEHVLSECQSIHHDNKTKVVKDEINSEDMETLRAACRKIEAIIKILEQQR